MREILFRGFHECETGTHKAYYGGEWHKGEWVYGAYFCLHHNDERDHIHHFIIPENTPIPKDKPIGDIQIEVAPETVCQYIGRDDDKNEFKIFEGDIIRVSINGKTTICTVIFADNVAQFQLCQVLTLQGTPTGLDFGTYFCEIIGNKFSNPELLEEENE